MAQVERTTTRITGFEGAELDFQLMRSLGAANYGGGSPGEIFHARQIIGGDDPYAWPAAFTALAQRVEQAGEEAAQRQHAVSAREHFLRASMYWRAAEYFSDPFLPAMQERELACRRAFLRATEFMRERITAIDIPFEGVQLPGYFMRPPGATGKGRTVVVLTGFDGTAEELYFQAALAGLERGFNVLLAEGPGQVGAMRLHPQLTFRPDYEKPIAAMLDVACAHPEVDPDRLALYGISFGGYFAIRGGEHDPRIRALIVNSPIVDLRRYMLGFTGTDLATNPPPLMLAEVDEIPDAMFPRAQKLAFKSACRRFGVESFAGWMNRLATFTAGEHLGQITCPTLAMIGTGEGAEATEQFEIYCARVSGPVTRRVFDVAEGADMHCQVGNLPLSCAIVYDWLEEVL